MVVPTLVAIMLNGSGEPILARFKGLGTPLAMRPVLPRLLTRRDPDNRAAPQGLLNQRDRGPRNALALAPHGPLGRSDLLPLVLRLTVPGPGPVSIHRDRLVRVVLLLRIAQPGLGPIIHRVSVRDWDPGLVRPRPGCDPKGPIGGLGP